MRRLIRSAALSIALLLAFTVVQPVAGAARLKDISGNWAADHITALVNKGVMGGYPDGTFRPNRTVTRAEFAKTVVKAFAIPGGKHMPYQDAKDHWAAQTISAISDAKLMQGYEDGTFRPNRTISRAEVVAVVVRALKLETIVKSQAEEPTSFSDIPAGHWAAGMITAAEQLDILPPYFRGRFRPTDPATRSEVAALVNGALRLQLAEGTVDYTDEAQMISVKTSDGTLRDFALSPAVHISRNNSIAEAKSLRKGDKVRVVADRFGNPVYVTSNGKATTQEVVNKVSNITRGILTPEQLKAAIKGDWGSVANGFQGTLYNQLLAIGATPQEADAIMQKDWGSLNLLGRERLSQAFGSYLGVSSELSTALLDQNWAQAKKLAEVEASQAILGRLLFGTNAS